MAAAALGAVAGDEAAYNALVDGYLAAKDESAYAPPMRSRHCLMGEAGQQIDHGCVRAD